MKVLTGILTLAALGCGAICVYLYSELDAARSEVVVRATPCRAEQAQMAVLQHACVELDTMQRDGLPADDPDSVEPVDARVQPETREIAVDARAFQAASAGRDASKAPHQVMLRRMHRGVAEELNLSPDQESELLALLYEHQTEHMETARTFVGDRAAITQAMNELRQGNETELMTLLGDKYLEFEGYQKSLGERMQIEQAALQLEAAGVPLKDEQRRNLLELMVDERDRVPRPPWTPGVPLHENTAKQQEWQADYEERLRDRASSLLSSDQLKQYDVYRNLQSATRRRQLDAWRETSRRPLNAPSSSPGPT